MNQISWRELLESDNRLRRRVAFNPSNLREIMVLTRDALRANGDLNLVENGTPLDGVNELLLDEHGLARINGLIRAKSWYPSWLESGRFAVGEGSALRKRRQSVRSVEADSFYRQTLNRATYRTAGQQLAARCAVSAGPGDVLTCVLPTGSGKTDVFLLRAMQIRPRQTVVIVPTVSLALDLERRVRDLTASSDSYSYFGDLLESEKSEFRRRIAAGDQWLTITSPEAACTSLADSLKDAATAGKLGLIVIDEAHIVAEWGDDFRLEFQTFAALRNRLEKLSPEGLAPATMLLTGTLDQYGYDTLGRLFPGKSEVLVSDQSTRPEPEWWICECADEAEKRERLLDAVAHLPRPLLIYTSLHRSTKSTTVSDVCTWLFEAGYRFVGGVAGSAPTSLRSAAVRGLRLASPDPSDDLDIVVATSAFGMGVDIDDVRAVIHACVPETINRMYQEVGRGGRDGSAAVALMLWTPEDISVAKGLAAARQISGDIAWARWKRLRLGMELADRLSVDLTTPHPGVRYPFSEANRFWNMQTLLGMQRAEMLRIDWPDPPNVRLDASDDELADAFARRHNEIAVTVLQGDLTEGAFVARFNDARSKLLAIGNASLTSTISLVRESGGSAKRQCLNSQVARSYRFVDREYGLVPMTVDCGGCYACRNSKRSNPDPQESPYSSGRLLGPNLGLGSLVGPNSVMCVTSYGDQDAERTFFRRLSRNRTLRFIVSGVQTGILNALDPSCIWWHMSASAYNRLYTDPTDILTVLVADSIGDESLRMSLRRINQLSCAIVYIGSDRIDPDDDRFMLTERFPLILSLESAIRRI